MKAFQLLVQGSPATFELREMARLGPGAGEVVVEVHACGLNHLDLWFEQGALPVSVPLPRTPGCEIAGRVAVLGEGVTSWEIGARVAVQSNLSCGECEYCHVGQDSMCLNNVMLGVQRDGGLAEEVVVPARSLMRLPEGVDFRTSAALSLAGSTAMHMLTNRASVRPGQWVLVMAGASGVGSAAIQVARELGGRVISSGSTPAKRDLATRLGVELVVDLASPAWTAEVRKFTGKRGVDVVVEHIGGKALEQVFQCLARGGTVVTCGATAGQDISINLWPFFVKQQRLVGSYGRNSADLQATLDWAASGRLKPVIDSTFGLDKADAALARLRSRQALGKVIVQPGKGS